MSFNINKFASDGLAEGGARATHFQVDLFPPPGLVSINQGRFSMAVQSASLPGSYVGQAAVSYFGRILKFAGDRTIEDWAVSIQNDASFPLRSYIEKWSNEINALVSNRMNPSLFPTKYKGDAEVTQFKQDGTIARSYIFTGIWPMQVSPIRVDWSAQNQIEMFDVMFSVDWFAPNIQTGSDNLNPILADDGGQFGGNPAAPTTP